MSDYFIGLSGMAAAQRAFDVIGNNIANAATEGYHRQRLELSPAFIQLAGTKTFLGGVNIEGVSRMIDRLLEQELLHQKSAMADVSRQTSTLGTIEAAFGEFATENGGLGAVIDDFFNSLQDQSLQPEGAIWQNQVVSSAQAMTSRFRALGEYFDTLQNQIKLEAQRNVDMINTLVEQIAELNDQIERIEIIGGQANSMKDQRDQYITELSEYVEVQTVQRNYGVMDVSASGLSLVTGTFATLLQAGYNENAQLAVAVKDTPNYTTNIQGGKLSGLMTLHNDLVAGYINDLDALANAIIQEINNYHTIGTGSAGSFTELTGRSFVTENLSDIETITDGSFFIRVTNTATGEITRHEIAIDAANDTLSDVAAAISAVAGLTASVNTSNELTIVADANYTFDFMPAVLPEPTLIDFDDASPPAVTVTGIYEQDVNDTLEFTVIGDGSVGNGTLSLEVRDNNGAGELIATLNIGSGYAAGDWLDVGNGIQIALSMGNLAESNGDTFSIDVFSDADTANFLAATGINTFFSGDSALEMAVCSEILENPQRVATAIGPDGTDNINIKNMAAIKDLTFDSLGTLTCAEFFRKIVSDVGQEYSVKQKQQESIEVIIMNLTTRQQEISGVDINEEAAQLLVFEQMFQAMAQFMNTINESIASLMEIV
jgi:flagellar hook-associated protein 1 FlgK